MGWLEKMLTSRRAAWGEPNQAVLAQGLIGRGVITGVQETMRSIGADQVRNFEVVCDLTMDVTVLGRPPYQAALRQAVKASELTRIVPGQTGVVVRVDRGDQSQVAIDWELTLSHELYPPGISGPRVVKTRAVTVATGMSINLRQPEPHRVDSAAQVLANGYPVRVALLQCELFAGTKSADGLDIYLFTFLVLADGQEPYGVKVGNPVPDEALRLLQPWRNLPAKVMAGQPERVVIDWPAALAEPAQ